MLAVGDGPHFKREEFECDCGCGFNTVDFELFRHLEYIRKYFNAPVVVTSGCRCAAHNAAVGGSQNSQHLYGRAADIIVSMVPAELVAELAEEMGLGGVGRYKNFTHIDTRVGKARWSGA